MQRIPQFQQNPLQFDLSPADITRRTEEIIAASTYILDSVAKVSGIQSFLNRNKTRSIKHFFNLCISLFFLLD